MNRERSNGLGAMSNAGRRKSDPPDSVGDIPGDLVQSWVRRYRNRMVSAARGYEGRAVTAEDIVQEAFCRAVLQFHTLRKQTAIGKCGWWGSRNAWGIRSPENGVGASNWRNGFLNWNRAW